MNAAGVAGEFEQLSFTGQREIVSGLASAKKPETRQRRIESVFAELLGSRLSAAMKPTGH